MLIYAALPSQDEDISLSLPELLATPWGIVTVVSELAALVAMLPFVLIEIGSLQAYAGNWLGMWNALDVLTYSLQVRSARRCRCMVRLAQQPWC